MVFYENTPPLVISYVDTPTLCDKITKSTCFGLREAIKKNCKNYYVLDTYYNTNLDKFRNSFNELSSIKLYSLTSIKRASQLLKRHHMISVIGF